MRADLDEYGDRSLKLVNCSDTAGDIDAPIALPFAVKRMIINQNVVWLF